MLEPARGQGWKVIIPHGKRNIVVRIMEQGGIITEPYFRVSIEGKGGITWSGQISSNADLTHHKFSEFEFQSDEDAIEAIAKLIRLAKAL
jgi:hypothetical protein